MIEETDTLRTIPLELPTFEPRWYQDGVCSAMDAGYKRVLLICHRRWGKDLCCINLATKMAFRRLGTYNYYLPTQVDARGIVWNGMDKSGKRFIDYIPKALVKRKLDKEMMIEFINGSILQFRGTDNATIVGVNPVGTIFSEYALQNPKAWEYIQPILRENGGWALFQTTFRGKHNHAFRLYKNVVSRDDWYVEKQDIIHTGAVSEEEIAEDIKSGLISYNLAQQEYFNNVDVPVEGSYFGAYIETAEKEERVGEFPVDTKFDVFTMWDLGIRDAMAIWWFQMIPADDGEVRMRVVDYFEDTNQGIAYYVKKLVDWQIDAGCRYGAHFAPHDINQRGFTAETKHRQAEDEGLYFEKVPLTKSVSDDIETMRRLLPRVEWNEAPCRFGIDLVASYHAKKIERMSTEGRPIFDVKPVHDGYDGVSALRTGMMAWSRGMIRNYGMGDITKVRGIDMPDTYGAVTEEKGYDPANIPSYLDNYRDKHGHLSMGDLKLEEHYGLDSTK